MLSLFLSQHATRGSTALLRRSLPTCRSSVLVRVGTAMWWSLVPLRRRRRRQRAVRHAHVLHTRPPHKTLTRLPEGLAVSTGAGALLDDDVHCAVGAHDGAVDSFTVRKLDGDFLAAAVAQDLDGGDGPAGETHGCQKENVRA